MSLPRNRLLHAILMTTAVACAPPDASDRDTVVDSNAALGAGRFQIFPASDSCSGELVPVGLETPCGSLSGSAWSVLVDGQCLDIVDTTAANACEQYRNGLPRGPRLFASSDSCGGSFIPIDRYTRCNSLPGNTWSVLDGGECLNIVDTTAAEACREYQYGVPRGPRIFSASDSCGGAFIPIGNDTRCDSLTGSAWSILDGGECLNIVDTTAALACREYQYGVPRGPRIFSASDSCGGAFIPIDNDTRCDSLSGSAWSILVGGQCQNIVDTSAANACRMWESGAL
jgi:hypothetical protein